MHLLRRSAFRAISAPSFSSPVLLATQNRAVIAPALRRFFGNDEYSSGNFPRRDGYERNTSGYQANEMRIRRPPPVVEPSQGLYIGNVPFAVSEADLKAHFEEFGEIVNIKIAKDTAGLSKGFAFIDFKDTESAAAAVQARHQTELGNRTIVVNFQARKAFRMRDQTNEPSKTLFVGNLAFEMSDADLNKLFREIKNIIDVRVAVDRRTGQPRGFAHAEFLDIESATAAKEFLTGKELYGRTLRIDFSGDQGPRFPPRDEVAEKAESTESTETGF